MQIRIGYELVYQCPQATPMILTLNVHPSRASSLITPDTIQTEPKLASNSYRDSFGNICTRIVAPAGRLRVFSDALIHDHGQPEPAVINAVQHDVQNLPADTLVYLLPSRYCESDVLAATAWQLFGHTPLGWERVQAIVDYVHNNIEFGYQYARPTKTAAEAWNERRGVCRDFAHVAIAFCRAMNIPARYCTAYLGDIGVPKVDAPMDFAGSMEVYLGGAWHAFDPRNNQRRIGRILIARGRDAADVAITTSYGPHYLESFKVVTEEVPVSQQAMAA